MRNHSIAVLDACVLYPAMLRNLLIQLATTGLYQAKWTDKIHEEWIRGLRRSRPDLDPKKLARVRELMNSAVPDCLVVDYEPLIAGLDLPDPDDRHVLGAAIRCHAEVIVTTNLRHFPDDVLRPFGVHAQHPDAFLTMLIELDLTTVCRALKAVRSRLVRPPFVAEELLDHLQRQGLPESVAKLRAFTALI